MIASGQSTQVGFMADVILWSFSNKVELHRLSLHKGCVTAMSFSFSNRYLVSLGGRDDGQMVIWDVSSGVALASTAAHSDGALECAFYSKTETAVVTCGNNHVKKWVYDEVKKKLTSEAVNLGSLKRSFTCVRVNVDDSIAYCGTQSGDLVEVGLPQSIQKRIGPVKTQFPQGISVCALIPQGDLLVGTGEGVIAKISTSTLRVVCERKLSGGGITSISLTPDGTKFFVGTDQSYMYLADAETLEADLRSTCHTDRVNAIAFPHNMSEIFATSSMSEIRLWNSASKVELLRITVPQKECFCMDFALDGKSIVSGWSDGKLRSFTPQTGKLIYAITDAHKEGVTALKMLSDCTRIVSGGMHGDVRIWKVQSNYQELVVSLKEHRGRVWSVVVRTEDDARAVTASADGSCIVWDIQNKVRIICVFESTVFRSAVYHPDFSQIVTVGSDRRVTYIDVFTGETLRILEGAIEGNELTGVAVSASGSHLVVVGGDSLIKLIDYESGDIVWIGKGHSACISALAIAPNQEFIVTGGADGGLFFWHASPALAQTFVVSTSN